MSSKPTDGLKFCTDCGSKIKKNAEICPECGVSQRGNTDPEKEASTRLASSIIGGIGLIFIGWVPFLGPILGGALAGSLRGKNNREGAIVGTIGAVLASIPFLLFAAFGGVAQIAEGTAETFIGWIFLIGFLLLYFYGCAALGGWVGAEFSSRPDPTI